MNKYIDYNKTCTILQIGNYECSFQGQMRIIENFQVLIEIVDVQREIYLYMQKEGNILLRLRTDREFVTVKGFIIKKGSARQTDENFKNPLFRIELVAFNVCWGNSWCGKNIEEFLFDGFSCDITEGIELLGLAPYEKIELLELYGERLDIHVKGQYKTIKTRSGFSYIALPNATREGTDLCFGIKSQVIYHSKEMMKIEEVRKKINNMILFFEILSGESITTTQVSLMNKDESFDYLGNCNYPKNQLCCFGKSTFDSRSFIRKSLFKVSDFYAVLDSALDKFNILIKDKYLAFDAYKQILLDEDVGISTTNKFLKVMQVIEGVERNDVNSEEQKEFEERKLSILDNIENEEDKQFLEKYCTNNGDNFIKCLQKMTRKIVMALSEISNREFKECHTHSLLEKIKNDRDVYTHASHTSNPILNTDELYWVIYCYKTFFRVEILLELGLDIKLIRNRLSYDRMFVGCYDNLFHLKIKVDEDFGTGEFDDLMWI